MIACHGITYHFGQSDKGLNDVSFSVEKGQIIGVIGENGAGKSTLFKCLLGLMKPTDGVLTHRGNPLSYDKRSLIRLRQDVNMVLQDPERQIFYNSVFEEISMGPKNLGLKDEALIARTKRCIEEVDASDFSDMPIQYLSFGQKKRVAIAGILALNCDVILLDEPETGLDPKMKRELIKLLMKLASNGKKIVIASHNMDLIYELCDYIYILHKGRLLTEGIPETVMCDESIMSKVHLEIPLVLKLSKALNLEPEILRKHLKSDI